MTPRYILSLSLSAIVHISVFLFFVHDLSVPPQEHPTLKISLQPSTITSKPPPKKNKPNHTQKKPISIEKSLTSSSQEKEVKQAKASHSRNKTTVIKKTMPEKTRKTPQTEKSRPSQKKSSVREHESKPSSLDHLIQKTLSAENQTPNTSNKHSTQRGSKKQEPSNKVQNKPVFISNPQFKYRPSPKYPRRARARGIEGTVIIRSDINRKGHVKQARIHQSSGHTVLDNAALKAVQSWQFEPAKNNGVAVPSIVQFPVSFELR